MRKLLKSNQGFTLVELMVVVAIIGILSAVAIPNFKKYQAKAKTSEAKLALSAMYSAETALITDYDSYDVCLDLGGYTPTSAKRYYRTGFKSSTAKLASGVSDTNCTAAQDKSYFLANKKVAGHAAVAADAEMPAGVSISTNAFTVGAGGFISSNANADQWTIDATKNVQHVKLGY